MDFDLFGLMHILCYFNNTDQPSSCSFHHRGLIRIIEVTQDMHLSKEVKVHFFLFFLLHRSCSFFSATAIAAPGSTSSGTGSTATTAATSERLEFTTAFSNHLVSGFSLHLCEQLLE